MKRAALATVLLFLAPVVVSRAQGDFDFQGFINQEGTAEVQAIASSFGGGGTSVVDTMAQAGDNLAPITGNDYVEGALGKGIQALGGGVLGELPIADGSAALGYAAGGDYQAAADTAVAGSMGAVAGWSAASLLGTIAVDGVITVGAFSAPAWVPAVIVGGTVAWATKSLYDWMLHPPGSAPAGVKPSAIPVPRKPAVAAPTRKPRPAPREHEGKDKGGGREGHSHG